MKRIVCALTIATLVLLLAQPAIGQASRERPIDLRDFHQEEVINECTGELVTITGKIRIWNQELQTPSGESHFKGQTTLHGKGVGSEGQRYVYNYVANHQGPLPDTSTINLVLVNKGSGSDFHVKSTVHISPNGKIIFHIVDSTCRG